MRKPSEARLRLLAEVANGRVRRTGGPGWIVSSQPANGSEGSALRAALAEGWIATERAAIDPLMSVPVHLTDAGRDVLARYWPDWRPTR